MQLTGLVTLLIKPDKGIDFSCDGFNLSLDLNEPVIFRDG